MPEDVDLVAANAALQPLAAPDRLRWAAARFGPRFGLLASMQKTSSVLLQLWRDAELPQPAMFVDTGFHFHETLALRDEWTRRGVAIHTAYPLETPQQQEDRTGRKLHLYVDGQPECCRLRKEEPFLRLVRELGLVAVASGLRRAEGERRKHLLPLAPDPRVGGYAFHPIFDWDDAAVEAFLAERRPPVHPLHARRYPSIGCQCCTTPVAPGESPRAGRWRHLRQADDQPQYCGINFTDGSGI